MSRVINHCPPQWKSKPLYRFLMEAFPEHHTPFNRLDVNRLAEDIGKSYESLYHKLRQTRLNVEWAKLLCEFANDEERLVQSARKYAETLQESSDPAVHVEPAAAEAAVRKRFNARRKPLTIEQDFLHFFM